MNKRMGVLAASPSAPGVSRAGDDVRRDWAQSGHGGFVPLFTRLSTATRLERVVAFDGFQAVGLAVSRAEGCSFPVRGGTGTTATAWWRCSPARCSRRRATRTVVGTRGRPACVLSGRGSACRRSSAMTLADSGARPRAPNFVGPGALSSCGSPIATRSARPISSMRPSRPRLVPERRASIRRTASHGSPTRAIVGSTLTTGRDAVP